MIKKILIILTVAFFLVHLYFDYIGNNDSTIGWVFLILAGMFGVIIYKVDKAKKKD
jgi:hypothetical protein